MHPNVCGFSGAGINLLLRCQPLLRRPSAPTVRPVNRPSASSADIRLSDCHVLITMGDFRLDRRKRESNLLGGAVG